MVRITSEYDGVSTEIERETSSRGAGRALSSTLLIALVALVCVRGWVPLVHYAHFDSDQAVFGIMSRDLAAGRGVPMFFYGQRYLLAVSVWLCAPLFLLFGASLATLKLPLLLLNVAVVCMLWIGLRREPAMSPWSAALAILPIAMPTAIVATRLVENAGGNIEPFVFVLAAHFLRDRPMALGAALGVGVLNREFALIGFIALLLMDAAEGTLLRRIKAHAITIATLAGVVAAVRFAARWSIAYGGSQAIYRRGDWLSLAGLFGVQLPTLLGGTPHRLSDFNILSSLTLGHDAVYVAFLLWAAIVVVALALRFRSLRRDVNGMSTYLALIGLGQAAAYVLLAPYPRDIMVVRYVLLCLLGVSGLVALAWRVPALRAPTAGVILSMTVLNFAGNVELIHEYAVVRPERPEHVLTNALVQRGVRYAQADYWTAFDVAWLSGERVIASPLGGFADRVQRYVGVLNAHRSELFVVQSEPRQGCDAVARWYVCPPSNAAVQAR